MYRKEMPQYEGMLFVFEQPSGSLFPERKHIETFDRQRFIGADDGSIAVSCGHEASNDRLSLRSASCALCARNESGLVR